MSLHSIYKETKKNYDRWEKEDTEAYREYRHRWEHDPENNVVGYAPIHVDIEVTAACNLKCPMCLFSMERMKGEDSVIRSGFMSWDLYQKIIDEASRIGVSAVKLMWRGEALLHPEIVRMVRYARQKGILEIMMNTNAVCLSEELSKDLIEAGLDKIIFSVDSIDKEEYERIRVGAVFENVMANIKRFCEIDREAGHPVLTRVQRVKLEDTDVEQERFEKYFEGIVDVVAYNECVPYGEDLRKVRDRFKERPQYKCPQLWQRLLIAWNGKCFMCCEDGKEEYEVGDINKEGIHEIWVGERLERARTLHKEGRWYMLERCNDCARPYMES